MCSVYGHISIYVYVYVCVCVCVDYNSTVVFKSSFNILRQLFQSCKTNINFLLKIFVTYWNEIHKQCSLHNHMIS